jgi:hypothetical protein
LIRLGSTPEGRFYGIPFRVNTVLSAPALGQLSDIARLAVRTGAEVVNFLGFNRSTMWARL